MRLFHALLGANARNLLTFDAGQQHRIRIAIDDNVGWLDFTHGITFANAVRVQCARFPELWPAALLANGLFQRTQRALHRERDGCRVMAGRGCRGVHGGSGRGALRPWHRRVHRVGHRLKTVMAAREELRADPPAEVADLITAGLNRFLHARLKRKQVRRNVYQAMKFVARDG